MTEADEGIRLAKRVAALAGCSRREAELLIENGAVRVDGTAALLPQSRVHADQAGRDRSRRHGREPVVPVTLLLHKPAGMPTDDAAPAAGAGQPPRARTRRPALPAAPRRGAALHDAAGDRRQRPGRLHAGMAHRAQAAGGRRRHRARGDGRRRRPGRPRARWPRLDALRRPASASASRPKATPACASPSRAPARARSPTCATTPACSILAMKRIRIGRVPLAGLLPGQWRYLIAERTLLSSPPERPDTSEGRRAGRPSGRPAPGRVAADTKSGQAWGRAKSVKHAYKPDSVH